jgi:hypothetical protein
MALSDTHGLAMSLVYPVGSEGAFSCSNEYRYRTTFPRGAVSVAFGDFSKFEFGSLEILFNSQAIQDKENS